MPPAFGGFPGAPPAFGRGKQITRYQKVYSNPITGGPAAPGFPSFPGQQFPPGPAPPGFAPPRR